MSPAGEQLPDQPPYASRHLMRGCMGPSMRVNTHLGLAIRVAVAFWWARRSSRPTERDTAQLRGDAETRLPGRQRPWAWSHDRGCRQTARYHPLSMDDKVTLLGDPHADMAADLMDRVAARGVRSAARPLPVSSANGRSSSWLPQGYPTSRSPKLTVSVRVVEGPHLPRMHQTRCRRSRVVRVAS